MNVNDDFSRRVIVHSNTMDWEASPMTGVERRRLDRVAGEHERVTTIVRYAPGSRFSPHTHPAGEEFLVLDGTFEDDAGSWPRGAYVRNPPGSSHTPGSTNGCTILVKLCQFDAGDDRVVHIHTDRLAAVADRHRPGVAVKPLFYDGRENVRLEIIDAASDTLIDASGGAELFVLAGRISVSDELLCSHDWLREPADNRLVISTGKSDAVIWVKTGHLADL